MCLQKSPYKKHLHFVVLAWASLLFCNTIAQPAAQDGAAQNNSQKKQLYFSSERSFVFAREEEMQRATVCVRGSLGVC